MLDIIISFHTVAWVRSIVFHALSLSFRNCIELEILQSNYRDTDTECNMIQIILYYLRFFHEQGKYRVQYPIIAYGRNWIRYSRRKARSSARCSLNHPSTLSRIMCDWGLQMLPQINFVRISTSSRCLYLPASLFLISPHQWWLISHHPFRPHLPSKIAVHGEKHYEIRFRLNECD